MNYKPIYKLLRHNILTRSTDVINFTTYNNGLLALSAARYIHMPKSFYNIDAIILRRNLNDYCAK